MADGDLSNLECFESRVIPNTEYEVRNAKDELVQDPS